MTREEIKAIIPEITDDNLKKVLDINGKDINKAKGSADEYKSQLDTAKADLEKANTTIKDLEANKGNAEALQAEIDKYKKAEEDRQKAEKEAADNKALTDRFEGLVPETHKFINDFTKSGVLAEFKAALADEANKGKGDKDIFDAIIKDREGIFENPNKPRDIPGAGGAGAEDIDDAQIRAVMGLPPKKD